MKHQLWILAVATASLFAMPSCLKESDDNSEYQKQYEQMCQENLDKGKAYLDENGKREGVKTTDTGLQYEVLKEGNEDGKQPKATDKVKCHYQGTLIDGTIFDSSYKRNEPSEFALNQVISGWTEGLQLMKEGAKYRFVLPYNLAYGPNGNGSIPPYSTLIFEVELLEVK